MKLSTIPGQASSNDWTYFLLAAVLAFPRCRRASTDLIYVMTASFIPNTDYNKVTQINKKVTAPHDIKEKNNLLGKFLEY